jgi:phosphinothricin acetyltransferase
MSKPTTVVDGQTKVRVRKAVLHDVQIITEIHNQGIVDRESVLDITPYPLRERLAWFKNLGDREVVLVAETGGLVVGFCALQPYSPEEVYAHIGVASIWIEKEYRGRDIGRKIARSMFAAAKKKGYSKLMFSAYSFNRRKMGFYKKMGYERVGVLKRHAMIKNELVDVLVMEYQL